MAFKFVALFALLAVAQAQHYNNDYYHSNNYDNHHHYAAPAVIKHVQPAVVKHIQPAVIKHIEPAVVKHIQPAVIKQVHHEEPANYEFNYDVHDHHTGDIKQQHEVAHNGAVQGEYSLIDADGYRRIVSYTADDHQGFVAHVRREPIEGHKIIAQPAVAKIVSPITKIVAQPAIAKIVAPVQYATPVQHHYSAPAQHYSAPVQHHYSAPAQHYSAPVQHHYSAPAQHYSAPVQHHYSAPAVKVAVPVVQKYLAPAPVVEKYVQPQIVQKYVAPKYTAVPVVKAAAVVAQPIKYTSAEHSAHVSVNAPHVNYHY